MEESKLPLTILVQNKIYEFLQYHKIDEPTFDVREVGDMANQIIEIVQSETAEMYNTLLSELKYIESICDNQNPTHEEIWTIAYSAINSIPTPPPASVEESYGTKLINAIQHLQDLGLWENWKEDNPVLLNKLIAMVNTPPTKSVEEAAEAYAEGLYGKYEFMGLEARMNYWAAKKGFIACAAWQASQINTPG